MDIIEAEALMLAIQTERDELKQELARVTEQRNALPRNDKKGARELLLRQNELNKRIKGLGLQHREARHRYEAKERHGLWETAILTLWGQDGLTAARHQMKSERMQRDGVVPHNPNSNSVASQKEQDLTIKPSPELRADLIKLHDAAVAFSVDAISERGAAAAMVAKATWNEWQGQVPDEVLWGLIADDVIEAAIGIGESAGEEKP